MRTSVGTSGVVAGAAFVVTGLWHLSGSTGISAAAASQSEIVRVLLPALWIAYGVHLLLLGGLAFALSRHGGPSLRGAWVVLALIPAADALVQVVYAGFIPPTVALLTTSAVSFLAAARLGRPSPAAD